MREHGYIGHEPITSPNATSAPGMWSRMRVMELARRSLWPLNFFYLPDILSRLQYTRTAQANRVPANNIANDTTSTPAGTYPGSSAFIGGVLLPDGRVFCVPLSSTSARIYDPVANSVSTPAGTYPGTGAFVGGILLPDGRVFCVPLQSTTARIYDPVANTVSTPAGTYPGSSAFIGGVLLPDGRVFCVPYSSTSARIYDPVANTVSTPAGTYPGTGAFEGGVLLPDGRVFCVPRNSTSARLCSGDFSSASFNFDPTTLLSSYLNKY